MGAEGGGGCGKEVALGFPTGSLCGQDTPNGSGLQALSCLHQLPLLCSSDEQLPAGPADLISGTLSSKRPFTLSCSPTPRGLLAVLLLQISTDQTRQVGDSIDWVCLAGDWGHTLGMEKEVGSDGTGEETEQRVGTWC